MKLEFSIAYVIMKGRFLLVNPVNSFSFCQALLAVVIDEDLLFKNAAHALHGFLIIYPVVCAAFGNEDFTGRRGYKQIRLDIAHHGSDERVEPVINR